MTTTSTPASDSATPIERFELSPGVFVYRAHNTEDEASFLCPTCFEAGTTSILRRSEATLTVHRVCDRCDARFLERKKPLTNLAMSPWSGF
ncbi:hypothetical protein [Propionivibrio dicarboxylicus]|uniref:Uncharacterized protein n=1 Tax=Propionivibrio dicarboxylicus TaxID=83767 RepID=A0A1G7YHR6_9RHOO|nr:hypothetical protein [Propionivibrio dicarboxylicus]SDG95420.1 hypothetical protein SAMN05660652_00995 [Propionivibrio dicarboxylicus]